MMAPWVYEEARANAPMHVQLWRPGAGELFGRSGSVRIHARVIRIFRDRDHELHWGQRISFLVPIMGGEAPDGPVLSGTISHDWDRMGRSPWLEAFLEAWNGEIELVRSQIMAIRHPTFRPVCGPDVKGFIPAR